MGGLVLNTGKDSRIEGWENTGIEYRFTLGQAHTESEGSVGRAMSRYMETGVEWN